MTVRTAVLLMAGVVSLLSLGFMVKSFELYSGWVAGRGPGSGAWPVWLSAGMLAATVVTIVRWFTRATPESRSTDVYMSKAAVSIVGTTVVALVGLLIGTYYIGIYF
jgi:hypothetical protein